MASASMSSMLLRSLRAAQQCAHRPCQIRQYCQLLSRTAETTRHSLRPLSRSNAFSTSTVRPAKTIEQLKARSSTGPFSWKSAVLFVLTGAGMIVYFQYEKARLERERIVEMSKGVGKPRVGGPFVLKDLNGETFTEENLKGKYSFVYFGFTHCPDICPDELDKMAEIIDEVRARSNGQEVMRPVFITCDPARDSPEVLRGYLNEFHKDIIGLTGTYEQVKDVCRQYRVYFSTPQNIKPGEDYLVDHSIYFYLMDPEGDFVECIGRQDTPQTASKVILDHIGDWKRAGKPLDVTPSSK
ncbi:Mitochondrial metallochaperone Sco1 [Trichophyton interdigitale]|uniref:Mitochondrial metallochaperone Sco1 n=1 Tax=Trichophyton interdigitale TaxID=101480 RepID=A0A9P4YHE3_9EURO|nr:Mitochondrial metallochaperone Sco1 [Trichophyton interdigitale]KAF3894810.1 Mitochondrial metallochaperone Sco1 [Trichophyton interdigitale]KAG8208511.1 Mitochondrial metallochaperone Sco1 [Trichophyton interdigitale]